MHSIVNKTILKTSSESIVRDYINPYDFYNLIRLILALPAMNEVLDVYSKAPIDKKTLLTTMQKKYGLHYTINENTMEINATGKKPYYYSVNKKASHYGYMPTISSLDGIIKESSKFLDNKRIIYKLS
jgi:nucleoside-diphosphate-sugar epimerase